MHKFRKLVMTMGMLSLLSVMPLTAQVADSVFYKVVFTAPFSFYAGNVKLPAGSYMITQPNQNASTVLIRNIAGTNGEFVNFRLTSSLNGQKKSYVTFHKYGDTGYLRTLSLEGATDGIEFPRTKVEAKAETMAESTNENGSIVELAMLVNGK